MSDLALDKIRGLRNANSVSPDGTQATALETPEVSFDAPVAQLPTPENLLPETPITEARTENNDENILAKIRESRVKKTLNPVAMMPDDHIEFSVGDSMLRGALNLTASLSESVGATDNADELRTVASEFAASRPDITEVAGGKDLAAFAGERFLENTPQLGVSAVIFGLGSAIGTPALGAALTLGFNYMNQLGESRGNLRASGEDNLGIAIPTAVVNTGVEMIPLGMVAKKLGLTKELRKSMKEAVEELQKADPKILDRVKDAGTQFMKVGAAESGTEVIQTFNNMVANKLQNNIDIDALGENGKELLNAAAGGFFAGGTTGAIAGAVGDITPDVDPMDLEAATEQLTDPKAALEQMINERIADIEAGNLILEDAAEGDPAGKSVAGKYLGARAQGPWTNIGHHFPQGISWNDDGSVDHPSLSNPVRGSDGQVVHTPFKETDIQPGQVTILGDSGADPQTNFEAGTNLTGDVSLTPDQHSNAVIESLEAQKSVLDELMESMGLQDMKIVLGTAESIGKLTGGPVNGSGFILSQDDDTFYIGVNQHDFADSTTPTTFDTKTNLFDTAYHEFGHAVIAHKWNKMDTTQQQGLAKGYQSFMEDSLDMPYDQFLKKYYSPNTAKHYLSQTSAKARKKPFREVIAQQDPEWAEYLLNFDEYAAQQFARYATGRANKADANMSPEAKSFFDEVLTFMRRLYRTIKKATGTTETFGAFIDNMFKTKELADLQSAYTQAYGSAYGPTAQERAATNSVETGLEQEGVTSKDDGKNGSDNTAAFSPQKQQPIYGQGFLNSILSAFGLGNQAADMRQHEDLQMGFTRIAALLTPIQVAELATKSGIKNPALYMDTVRAFALTKMTQIEAADTTLQNWKKMGKDASKRISKMLYEASTKSDELERRLTPEEVQELASRYKLTADEVAMWQEIDASFQTVLGNIERGLVYEAARAYIKDKGKAKQFRDEYLNTSDSMDRLKLIEQYTGMDIVPAGDVATGFNPLFEETQKIEKSMRKLKDRNYFPRSRMGEYTVKVVSTKEGQEWDGHTSTRTNETLGFYAFDSKRDRDAALKEMLKDAKPAGVSITGSKMETESFSMMGMPQVMIDSLRRTEAEAINNNDDLTQNEKNKMLRDLEKRFADVSLTLSPGRKFLRHLQKRKGVAGFSQDAVRSYANYMMSAANHLARTEHARDLIEVLNDLDEAIKVKQQQGLGTVLDDLIRLRDYYRRHFNYLMRPDNDWAGLRSMGFLWYLGFNVKSALVNLTQIPMVTYPVLSSQYGDKNTLTSLTGAYKDVSQYLMGKKQLAPDEEAALDHLRKTGIIDESMVMELAGLGEQDVLKRSVPGMDLDGALNKISYYGAMGFRLGEKYNRTVTAIAAYRLARKAGKDHDAALKETQTAIERSQFEYAKWNRPEFMRGKKSVLFLFWQYMQHASFLFAGGAGKNTAARMWMVTLVLAGLEGVPFAETILDLIDFSGTQMKKLFGSPNPRVAIRDTIRDMLLEVTDQPDKVLYGASSYYGLGPLHLAALAGAPIPNIDIQGSLGFGKPVPWLEPLGNTEPDADKKLGEITAAVLGPVGGIPYQLYKSATSTDPNTWKNVERALPVFAKNAMKGVRWMSEGEETFRGEGQFLDLSNPEGRVATVMKGLGFQPTAITQKYRQINASQEAAVFWTLRKQLLLEDFYYTKTTGDREGTADVKKAIRNHNKGVREAPELRGLTITGEDMQRSLRQRRIQVKKREKGVAPSKDQVRLQREMQRLYPIDTLPQ